MSARRSSLRGGGARPSRRPRPSRGRCGPSPSRRGSGTRASPGARPGRRGSAARAGRSACGRRVRARWGTRGAPSSGRVSGRACTALRVSLTQLPEVAGEADLVEKRLRLLCGPGSPARIESRPPPCSRELVHLRRKDGRARLPTVGLEPAVQMLLRPEEDHRASSEADVVPPPARRDEDVTEEVSSHDHNRIADRELEAVAATCALGRDIAVGMKRARNPQRVPAARPRPRPPRGAHLMRCRCEAERVRHPDLDRVREENECVGVVGTLGLASLK